MKHCVLALLGAISGCATSGMQPPAQHFTGDPYDVVANRGVIAGEACGLTVHYAVSREGKGTVLLGAGTRRLLIRDEGGARHLSDLEARSVASVPVVDIMISADQIAGHVGARSFALRAEGDVYRGTYVMPGTSAEEQGEMEVAGRADLLQMPRAVLAAIAPPLLSCARRGWTRMPTPLVLDKIAVKFGGPVHIETTAVR